MSQYNLIVTFKEAFISQQIVDGDALHTLLPSDHRIRHRFLNDIENDGKAVFSLEGGYFEYTVEVITP